MNQERVVFIHGNGAFGAAAWPKQHGLALSYDCLFLKRHGFDAEAEPLATDFEADVQIVLEALGEGGHLVAASDGAVAAMMAAVARPDRVRSMTLSEPACLSLTADLPATRTHMSLMSNLLSRRAQMADAAFVAEFSALVDGGLLERETAAEPRNPQSSRAAARLRLQALPWEAPLSIVPGVPTLVLTGGWEPMFEEVARFLESTGAYHDQVGGGHRPLDTPAGMSRFTNFLKAHGGMP